MIFYLSATGNTRWAAEYLAQATGEKLISMAEAIHSNCQFLLAEDERIGFVFPVHGWRPPRLVRKFLSQTELRGVDGHFCFALFPFMDVDKPEKEKAKKQQAEKQLHEFAEEIRQRKRGICKTYKGHWPRTNSWLLGTIFDRLLISDKPFRVNADKCIRCGKCVEACITGNMTGGKGKLPQWKHLGDCCTCFACYHHCPVRAIEYGGRTKNKGQYYFTQKRHL